MMEVKMNSALRAEITMNACFRMMEDKMKSALRMMKI